MGALFRTHGKSQTPEYCMFYDARKRAIERGIPLGYTPSNSRVISFRANRIKSDASVAEIRSVLKYMEDAECAI